MLISGEKMLMSLERKRCVTWFIYFLDLIWVRYNRAKFHHCRICATYFWEGGLVFPPYVGRPQKGILNRVNIIIKSTSSKLSSTEPSLKDQLIALYLLREFQSFYKRDVMYLLRKNTNFINAWWSSKLLWTFFCFHQL